MRNSKALLLMHQDFTIQVNIPRCCCCWKTRRRLLLLIGWPLLIVICTSHYDKEFIKHDQNQRTYSICEKCKFRSFSFSSFRHCEKVSTPATFTNMRARLYMRPFVLTPATNDLVADNIYLELQFMFHPKPRRPSVEDCLLCLVLLIANLNWSRAVWL